MGNGEKSRGGKQICLQCKDAMQESKKIIDQELAQFGWVKSIATNSISDFKSPKSYEAEITEKKHSDLVEAFICHLIFYVIFCYSFFYTLFLI